MVNARLGPEANHQVSFPSFYGTTDLARVVLWLLLGVAGAASGGAGAQDVRTERVALGAADNRASIDGRIVGHESVSYLIGAEAGQLLDVTLMASNSATYFNIYAPGKGPGDAALANSSVTPELNRFAGRLPASGQYTVSVYMMRSAARRNERSDYRLDLALSPPEAASVSEPVEADVADGLQGGPDYWVVRTRAVGATLNLRASPSADAPVLDRLGSGVSLRNLGCRMAQGRRWCEVETLSGSRMRGWAAGDFLVEGSYRETGTSAGQPTTRTVRVQFDRGAIGKVERDRLGPGDAINYVLGARNGQFLTVRLRPDNSATHFNIFVPGGGTLYESEQSRLEYVGQLYMSGDHVVTVYYLGGAGELAHFEIEFLIRDSAG